MLSPLGREEGLIFQFSWIYYLNEPPLIDLLMKALSVLLMTYSSMCVASIHRPSCGQCWQCTGWSVWSRPSWVTALSASSWCFAHLLSLPFLSSAHVLTHVRAYPSRYLTGVSTLCRGKLWAGSWMGQDQDCPTFSQPLWVGPI